MAHARTAEHPSSLPPPPSKSRWMYPNCPLGTVSDIIYILVVLSTRGKWSRLVLVSDYLLRHSIQYLARLGYIFWYTAFSNFWIIGLCRPDISKYNLISEQNFSISVYYHILKVQESRKKHKNLHIYSSYLKIFEAIFKYLHLSVESKCHLHLMLRESIA